MAGPSASRLTKAGGNVAQARADLFADPNANNQAILAAAKRQFASDPAGYERWIDRKLHQTTKGKFSGPLGAIGKVVTKVAPYALPFIPGLGPIAAGALSAGVGLAGGKNLKQSLTQGALTGGASALLGGQGYKGVGGAFDRAKGAIKAAGATGIGKAIAKDPLKAATIGLSGLSAIQGAKRAGQADTLINRATSAIPTLAAPARVDLSSMFADPTNPYATAPNVPKRAAGAARYALAGG